MQSLKNVCLLYPYPVTFWLERKKCIFIFLSLLHNGEHRDFLMKMGQKIFSRGAKKVLGTGIKSGWVGVEQTNKHLWAALSHVQISATIMVA